MDETKYIDSGSNHSHGRVLYLVTLIVQGQWLCTSYELDIGYEVVEWPRGPTFAKLITNCHECSIMSYAWLYSLL